MIEGDSVPEFDNLYLDMNSILHTCTHTDDPSLSKLSDDQMYAAIFNYIDHLFNIIKPKQVFYMAIDGVAPRAKMNQQRARRFRTAYEAEEALKKAKEEGGELPKEEPFDSNAITPGTEFMANLTSNLKYFIHKKMSEDSRWSNIKVILSGHEVPGEGEHKIMRFIRAMKSKPDYNPNLRLCLYGLDADLIMLGLVTHDSHFSLLREEVTFGRNSRGKNNDIHDQKFLLLHLSLLREYLALEFQDLEGQVSFEYDFERILDDFILIMYVIGNDFLPNLPDLHINKGAFPLLVGAFKQSMIHSDGYLNEGGKINFKRLGIYLEYLSEFEFDIFEKDDVDVEWFNKRLEDISRAGEKKRERSGKVLLLQQQRTLVQKLEPWLIKNALLPVKNLLELADKDGLPTFKLQTDDVKQNLDFLKTFALEAGFLLVHSKTNDSYEAKIDVDGINPYESEDDLQQRSLDLRGTIKKYKNANIFASEELMKEAKNLYDNKFVDWKDDYYKEKLHFSIHDDDKIIDITKHYVEGLQWVLYYYYKGCASWNWFYRFHYAPRISDISKGINAMLEAGQTEVTFEKSSPFKPFEQLMAVLPARSRKLMPDVYRPLMTDEHSPIKDFYPHNVDIDLNGKKASWEAVVLLNFVDEKKLLETIRPIEAKLTPEEKKRNSYGKEILFIFNPQVKSMYASPLPGYFRDLEHDMCYEEPFELPEVSKDFTFILPEGAKLGKELLAGFPSLYTLPFTSELRLQEVKVFNFPSKSESMRLSIQNIWNDMTVDQFSQRFLGKVVYGNWPFLAEARVTKVVDNENCYEKVKTGALRKYIVTPLTPEERKDFHSVASSLDSKYAKTLAVQVGKVNAVVYLQKVTGMVRAQSGAYVKAFSPDEEPQPLQLIVENVVNEDERLTVKPPMPIDVEYPLGLTVIFLGAFAYGAPAQIAGYTGNDKVNIRIDKIQSTLEPNFGRKRLEIERKQIVYLTSFEAAKVLRVSGLFLSKISGSYMLREKNGGKVNIGLDMKFDARRLKVLGYTRKDNKFWEYSPLAIEVFKEYQRKFPQLLKNLNNVASRRDMPDISEVSNENEIKEVRRWLKEKKADMIQVSLESDSLTRFSISAIEQAMEDFISRPLPLSQRDIKGVPQQAIINPGSSYNLLSRQSFELGDRVIYVQDSGKVPKLSKGTIVAITVVGIKTSLQVVFDHPLVNGNNMNGKLNTNRGLVIDSSLVLNITNRQLVFHSKALKDKKPLTDAEREARAKQLEKNKTKQHLATKKAEKEQNAKKTNQLLSLLKKKNDDSNQTTEEPAADAKEDETPAVSDGKTDETPDANRIKQLYGHIYSDVMGQGGPAPGATFPVPAFGNPTLPGNVPPAGWVPPHPQAIPVVPGVPLPPQFFQNPPHPPHNITPPPANGDSSHGKPSRGRGGARSSTRGSRGASSRGSARGRGRGGRSATRGNLKEPLETAQA